MSPFAQLASKFLGFLAPFVPLSEFLNGVFAQAEDPQPEKSSAF